MKVYIVFEGEYSDRHVESVYSSNSAAVDYVASHTRKRDKWSVSETFQYGDYVFLRSHRINWRKLKQKGDGIV